MNLVIVNSAGLFAIGLIIWWFWLSKPRARAETGARPIDIIVDQGVYTPSRIEVPVGRPIILRFLRKDASPCAEKVLFDDFGIAVDLPVNEPTDVVIIPKEAGEFEFTCQMQMYRGQLIAIANR
ncbi:MAG: cupredoxin domain-containing protein [Acidiferrobacterales bacterium]